MVIRVFHGRVRGLAARTNAHSPSIMAAARPAWEQALLNNQGAPRYQSWGFDGVVDPRATMRGVAGMARLMAFFRDHSTVDRAVIDDVICPPAKAEIKDSHSRGQIPKAQIKNPWPLNARKLVYLIPIKEKSV